MGKIPQLPGGHEKSMTIFGTLKSRLGKCSNQKHPSSGDTRLWHRRKLSTSQSNKNKTVDSKCSFMQTERAWSLVNQEVPSNGWFTISLPCVASTAVIRAHVPFQTNPSHCITFSFQLITKTVVALHNEDTGCKQIKFEETCMLNSNDCKWSDSKHYTFELGCYSAKCMFLNEENCSSESECFYVDLSWTEHPEIARPQMDSMTSPNSVSNCC